MAYVLGFIYADGTVEDCRESSRTCYLQLTSKDKELLEEIRETMSSRHRLYLRPSRTINFRGKTYQCQRLYDLRIGNKKIYGDLLTYGLMPRKSLIIDLPKIPKKYFSFFLRGYFDGDGCVSVYKRTTGVKIIQVIYVSGSKIFLEKLNSLISDILGINLKNIPYQSNAYRLAYKTRQAVSVCRYMYKDLVLAPYLKRKYEIYQKYLTSRK